MVRSKKLQQLRRDLKLLTKRNHRFGQTMADSISAKVQEKHMAEQAKIKQAGENAFILAQADNLDRGTHQIKIDPESARKKAEAAVAEEIKKQKEESQKEYIKDITEKNKLKAEEQKQKQQVEILAKAKIAKQQKERDEAELKAKAESEKQKQKERDEQIKKKEAQLKAKEAEIKQAAQQENKSTSFGKRF